MKNRNIIFATIVAVTALSLAACGNSETTETADTTVVSEQDGETEVDAIIEEPEEATDTEDDSNSLANSNFVLLDDGENNYTDVIEGAPGILASDIPEEYRNFKTLANHDISFIPPNMRYIKGEHLNWNEIANLDGYFVELETVVENYHIRALVPEREFGYSDKFSDTNIVGGYNYNEETKNRTVIGNLISDYDEYDDGGQYFVRTQLSDVNNDKDKHDDILEAFSTNDITSLKVYLPTGFKESNDTEYLIKEDDDFYYFTVTNLNCEPYDIVKNDTIVLFSFICDKNRNTVLAVSYAYPANQVDNLNAPFKDVLDLTFEQAMEEAPDVLRAYYVE